MQQALHNPFGCLILLCTLSLFITDHLIFKQINNLSDTNVT